MECCIKQNKIQLRTFFHKDAYIRWHCTNEHFTVDEFIQANCDYPGQWDGHIERIEYFHDFIQNSAGRTFFYTLDIFGLVIHSKTQTAFFHVFSLNSRSGSRKMHVLLRKRISS